jgi:hypothetical protein
MLFRFLAVAGLAAAAASTASAASIGNDTFNASGSIDGGSVLFPDTAGIAQSTPGSCDPFSASTVDCDLVSLADTLDALTVDFIDGDSFEIGVSAGGFDPNSFVSFEVLLSGLDFTEGASSAPITGASFNINGGTLGGFLASVDNPTGADFSSPSITTTDTSIAISFASFDGQLFGDAPTIRFDVAFGSGPTPIPLPMTAPLLVASLALLALLRRRS